ncbi:Protein of unknown function [Cotesia congregata]|uniref:Endonuclease/exonuclease/phosphatase domain-containing protein n=1 Tax=Cotesia congregata TaxID=51543 RepID=A0A8J2HQH1_COTCN|nr:Protein of unknown function [Cotesia congregata]
MQNLFRHTFFPHPDIICLCETWATTDFTLPASLQDYTLHIAPVTKEKSSGHASGGIAIIAKKSLNITILDSSDSWLIAKATLGPTSIIIGNVYLRPQRNIASSLELLQLAIDEITQSHEHYACFLTCDFNAHVGPLGQISKEIILGTNLTEQRISNDQKIDTKGRLLTNFMLDNSFILLNGRTPSDSPGKFTYYGNGLSTIDFDWANIQSLPMINDMEVLHVENPSDHFPLLLTILNPHCAASAEHSTSTSKVVKTTYPWLPASRSEFKLQMLQSAKIVVDFNNTPIDDLSENLYNAVIESAQYACMVKKSPIPTNFKDPEKSAYINAKKNFKVLVKNKKRQSHKKTLESLANIKNAADFWATIKKHRKKHKSNATPIDIENWNSFYELIIPPKEPDDTLFYGKKLNLLTQYCQSNKLVVNVDKTRIIYCRLAGRLPRDLNFRFGDQKIEITENYEYLGLTDSASGFSHPLQSTPSTKLAQLSAQSSESSSQPKPTLYPTLLYASPIRALANLEFIEKIQCEFFKRVFGLPKTTAGALLRVELGRPRLAFIVKTISIK